MPFLKSGRLLISMNFEATKGGISRVAHLISESLPFDQVLSLHGNVKEKNVRYHQNNLLKFSLDFFLTIIRDNPSLMVFDHVGPASLLAFVPSSFLKGKKIIVFLHDEEAWSKVSSKHFSGLKKATHILCNSDYTYQRFISNNLIFKLKTSICLLAGVPADFKTSEHGALQKHDQWRNDYRPYILFVSRLWKEHRYKGHFQLLEAFHQYYIQREIAGSLRLAIVGNGNDVENINDFIKSHQLENKVTLFTDIDDHELASFYKGSAALIFPSIREGFGFVFLEAMYFCKACVGVRNQPAEEIIENGKTGILMNDNSPETILEVLFDIEENPEKYKTLGLEGKLLFNKKFTNDEFKKRFLTCLN